jgi:hypothetical protein
MGNQDIVDSEAIRHKTMERAKQRNAGSVLIKFSARAARRGFCKVTQFRDRAHRGQSLAA